MGIYCTWTRIKNTKQEWNTSCGGEWVMQNTFTPSDNKLMYCPMCGGELVLELSIADFKKLCLHAIDECPESSQGECEKWELKELINNILV
jgi:hypothetical protein